MTHRKIFKKTTIFFLDDDTNNDKVPVWWTKKPPHSLSHKAKEPGVSVQALAPFIWGNRILQDALQG